MKKLALLLLASTAYTIANSQSIGIGTTTPNANAALDIESSTKGLLIPRLNTAAREAITATKGLLVFDLTTNSFWFHTGSEWSQLATTSNTWSIYGNSNTTPGSHFLGTIDNQPIEFRIGYWKTGRLDQVNRNYVMGFRALEQNSAGTGNIAIGQATLHFSNRNDLIAIGDSALYLNGLNAQTGLEASGNIAIGKRAMYSNNTGYYNTAIGFRSMESNSSGYFNVSMGYISMRDNTSGSHNAALGYYSLGLNTTGFANTAVGSQSLASNFSGNNNSAFGYTALSQNTTGNQNTAVGNDALRNNDDGHYNTAVGKSAIGYPASSEYNTAVGYYALYFNEGRFNAALGAYALYNSQSGIFNTAMGSHALRVNATGSENVAVGYEALYASTGSWNTAVGSEAMRYTTTGLFNVAVGNRAMYDNLYGADNVAIGALALSANTTGSYRTAVGRNANATGTNYLNNTAIGYNAQCNASHQVRLGNTQVTSIGGVVGWTTVSDSRFKSNERSDVQGLAFITGLRPVSYNLDAVELENFLARKNGKADEMPANLKSNIQSMRFTGFNAQEVETLARQLGFEFSGIDAPKNEGDYYGLRYGDFVVPLVKAVQEQQAIIANLQRQIDELKKMIAK